MKKRLQGFLMGLGMVTVIILLLVATVKMFNSAIFQESMFKVTCYSFSSADKANCDRMYDTYLKDKT